MARKIKRFIYCIFSKIFENIYKGCLLNRPMRNQIVIFKLMYSAFDGLMSKELDGIIWMFFSVNFIFVCNKSVSQLD